MIARTVAMFALMKDLRSLDQFVDQTVRLQDQVSKTQAPLRTVVRDVILEGDQASEHLTDDPGRMAAGRSRLNALTDEYKQLNGASLPLREESLLLGQCLANLHQWRESVAARYGLIIRSLLYRAAGILAMLGTVFGLSELWRHFTFRYVQEDRRRRQFLTVRRIVTAALMIAVIGIGFISDLTSLFTFAGFLTAGIAVALQGIIVSIAAYFFLIGRYGIRIGDRLTVSGVSAPSVTGEVTDLGLVRFHLMELTGSGPEARPTGRTIVFPNSVIFLANPICRQMPGADFAWREAVVSLAPGADAALVRDGLMAAVNDAYAEYRPLLDQRPAGAEKLHGVRLDFPKPYSLLRAAGAGIDAALGYPASLRHAAEIDQIVARHLSKALAAGSKLQQSVAGTPRLGPVARV
jgi:small-conductance mechanosensitive channel